MASTRSRSRLTEYKCDQGHDFYSYSPTLLRECAFGRCGGVVRAVKGWLAPKKNAVQK